MTAGTLLAVLAVLVWGCAPATIDLVENASPPDEIPQVFDDRDWATVLRENVRDGLVDYEHLAAHQEPLNRYLRLIACVGPESTPGLFDAPHARLTYAINAYNAGVLRAVLHEKIPATMYPAGRPSLDHRYRLRVDGRPVTLHNLRTAARESSGGDARIEFALCGAALGCPPLSDQPFRADMLPRQLERLARAAMDRPGMVRIDHQRQRLLIGLPIADRRDAFLAYTAKLTSANPPTLLSALLQMADGVRREWLNTAVGYKAGIIPFDRTLNRRTPE